MCPSSDLCAPIDEPDAALNAVESKRVSPRMGRAVGLRTVLEANTVHARTFTANDRHVQRDRSNLRRAIERDDWQMALATVEADFKCELIAGLSGDQRTRPGARRTTRPALAWLDARLSIGWSHPEVDLFRRPAIERRMGPPFVVPVEEVGELLLEVWLALWDQDAARAFVLHGPDEALYHGDASMLPDRAVPQADTFAATPAFEVCAPEHAALVADQVLGRRVGVSDRPSQKAAHCD